MTLIQVLAEAGGISADAGDTVIVTRTDAGEGASANSSEPPEIGAEDAMPIANPTAPLQLQSVMSSRLTPKTIERRQQSPMTSPGSDRGQMSAPPPAISSSERRRRSETSSP